MSSKNLISLGELDTQGKGLRAGGWGTEEGGPSLEKYGDTRLKNEKRKKERLKKIILTESIGGWAGSQEDRGSFVSSGGTLCPSLGAEPETVFLNDKEHQASLPKGRRPAG